MPMQHDQQPAENDYPIGRGYGHDYMRGGEVFGGYGYSERQDYERRRGEQRGTAGASERRRADDHADGEASPPS
jgi:hypothetical protein